MTKLKVDKVVKFRYVLTSIIRIITYMYDFWWWLMISYYRNVTLSLFYSSNYNCTISREDEIFRNKYKWLTCMISACLRSFFLLKMKLTRKCSQSNLKILFFLRPIQWWMIWWLAFKFSPFYTNWERLDMTSSQLIILFKFSHVYK